MRFYLGEVIIDLVGKGNNDLATMNCIFVKGFSNGKGREESKNFYFNFEPNRGLIFKGGMNWAPYQLKDYMEFLKIEYLEFKSVTGSKITAEEFLGFLQYKRRSNIINDIIE
jgi:hypothetical protein